MKERPILFSGAMVRAILDGRKSQTRRVVRWPSAYPAKDYAEAAAAMNRSESKVIGVRGPRDGVSDRWRCPYGTIGDNLWCRETWGEVALFSNAAEGVQGYRTVYRADPGAEESVGGYLVGDRWKPSIHMPRWASRLTLEITGIRVERVQDISEADARAEGAGRGWYLRDTLDGEETVPTDHRGGFRALWDSINGAKPGCSWADNPFVWVVEFKRVEQEADRG